MFTVKVPNSSACASNQSVWFLDNDSIIMVQDGHNSLTFVNVNGEVEQNKNKSLADDTKELTIKIEGPIKIENNFNADIEEIEKEKKEKKSDNGSEHPLFSSMTIKKVQTKFKIEQIFTNRSLS